MSSGYGDVKNDSGNEATIDVRSDTVTKPTAEMREAMKTAVVGDDVTDDDPTVKQLEATVSALLGKEAGLFVPSGTMGNLIAIMVHCKERNSEMIVGSEQHIHLYESGSSAGLAGVHSRIVQQEDDGTIDLKAVEDAIRHDNVHYPVTKLICVENTMNRKGGKVLPVSYMNAVAELAHSNGVALHVDGARLFNAAVSLGVAPKDIVAHADSVSVCLSKGLGAPVGSILAGGTEFIRLAKRYRKLLGGGMRQVGVLAAPALVGLQDYETKLANDHKNCTYLAEEITLATKGSLVAAASSNILLLQVKDAAVWTEGVGGLATYLKTQNILVSSFADKMRMVTHHQISKEDCATIVKTIADKYKQLTASV